MPRRRPSLYLQGFFFQAGYKSRLLERRVSPEVFGPRLKDMRGRGSRKWPGDDRGRDAKSPGVGPDSGEAFSRSFLTETIEPGNSPPHRYASHPSVMLEVIIVRREVADAVLARISGIAPRSGNSIVPAMSRAVRLFYLARAPADACAPCSTGGASECRSPLFSVSAPIWCRETNRLRRTPALVASHRDLPKDDPPFGAGRRPGPWLDLPRPKFPGLGIAASGDTRRVGAGSRSRRLGR